MLRRSVSNAFFNGNLALENQRMGFRYGQSIFGNVIDFVVGKRNKANLRKITETLVFSEAVKVTTDKLNIYKELIPDEMHNTKFKGINGIERNNLTLRTHLKRLNRKTICFSKSLVVLTAVVKIYFWG